MRTRARVMATLGGSRQGGLGEAVVAESSYSPPRRPSLHMRRGPAPCWIVPGPIRAGEPTTTYPCRRTYQSNASTTKIGVDERAMPATKAPTSAQYVSLSLRDGARRDELLEPKLSTAGQPASRSPLRALKHRAPSSFVLCPSFRAVTKAFKTRWRSDANLRPQVFLLCPATAAPPPRLGFCASGRVCDLLTYHGAS